MSLNLNCLTPRLTTGYLNTQNDAYPGMSVAGTGANINQYLGQMGQELQLNYESAAALSYTTTGTLYAGKYQYVKFKAGSSPARGLALYWDDRANYVVTTVTPSGDANFAGICIMANTAGNYGWMQTEGDAVCQFKATLTKSAEIPASMNFSSDGKWGMFSNPKITGSTVATKSKASKD